MKGDQRQWVLVQHIVQCVERLREFAAKPNARVLYDEDWITQSGVLRVLQTMSESLQRMDKAFKDAHPYLFWHQIDHFRNVLVHGYTGELDHRVVWQVIDEKLGDVEQAMRRYLEEHDEPD